MEGRGVTDRHYFKMYFANLMSEVSLLVAEERGVYIGILCKIHEAQDAIPNDSQWLGRVCGCSTRRCNQIIADVVQKGTFTTQNDGRIHSLRAKKQLEKERKVEIKPLKKQSFQRSQ